MSALELLFILIILVLLAVVVLQHRYYKRSGKDMIGKFISYLDHIEKKK